MIVRRRPFLRNRMVFGLFLVAGLMSGVSGAVVRDVPMGGNAFLTKRGGGGGRDGGSMAKWSSPDAVWSVYFRVSQATELDLSLVAKAPQGESMIRATVNGKSFDLNLTESSPGLVPLGRIDVSAPGYVKLDLQGIHRSGAVFATVDAVRVSAGDGVVVDCVKDNVDGRFYWGRRGPSVHLGYDLPEGEPIEWFYNEVTVPDGCDPVGSYFMANGFGEGYFGMQVNGADERKILFSVWSPFRTDDPKSIPADRMVTLLKKGEGVHGGEFGGEGSGGQSYWHYPWKTGVTYRFLNRVRPDGKGSTIYTAWFYHPEKNQWKLIASFKRPATHTHLTGAHSFLENFVDQLGYLGRRARYGNQWACDVKGRWHELTGAVFTGDDIAMRKFRLDHAGGTADDSSFFLRNGGFFAETVKPGTRFKRDSAPDKKPDIDFKSLEGVTEGF